MDEAYALIEQMNWFLKPISKSVIYLFSTSQGQVILAILLFLYFMASFASSLWNRKMLHLAARSSYERGRVPGAEKITLLVSNLSRTFFQIIMKFPVLLAALLLLVFISGVTDSITNMHNYVENRKEINKLQTTLKHLDKSYKVAEMEVTNVAYSDLENIRTTLSLTYYDYADMGTVENNQEITIAGRDIYIDAYVMNFEYSDIVEGDVKNLAFPYRIFSNKVPQSEGVELKVKDENNIPWVFHRGPDDVYGITPEDFQSQLEKIADFITDQKVAREAGIRSIYGNAVHNYVRAGQKYEIRVEQSGGLVLNRL